MGMGHYERLLIRSLIASGVLENGWRFDIRFAGRAPKGGLAPEELAPGLTGASFEGYSPARLASLPWPVARAAVALRRGAPDLHHSLALDYPAPAGTPAVYTIHDLPPARFADEGTLPRWAGRAGREAQAILTPSEFAKRELVELLDLPARRVHVVPNGYERDVFHPDIVPLDAAGLATRGIPSPFLLYSGGWTRRKNVRALLDAWAMLAPRHPGLTLVLAGPTGPLQGLAAEARAPRVVVAGYLERDVLPRVLKAATALVYPSIYEGFGLPPLEAMALGVPVVAVRAGAVPEVVGDCAVLADSGAADSLASAMECLLGDPARADSLRRSGPGRAGRFSWEAHAARVLDIYREVTTA
jgi:glycosyltransferase involved in cell wall biosynthesis